MRRWLSLIILVVFSFTGCTTMMGSNTNVLRQPSNSKLSIKGTWVVDETSNSDNNTEKKMYFDLNNVLIDGTKYNDVHYKLKIVDSYYIISYEHNIELSNFVDKNSMTDVYSIISNDKLICELFLIKDDYAIISYKENITKIKKVSSEIEEDVAGSLGNDNNELIELDENNTGLMLALKSDKNNIREYRTLWIPYNDKKLSKIYQLPGITFPRKDGIYKIESELKNVNGYNIEEFKLINPENNVISYPMYDITSDRYRSITYIGNNYIGIEESTINEKTIQDTKLKVLPVQRLNSKYGVEIQELYGDNGYDEYKRAIFNVYQENGNDEIDKVDIDYTNYTLYRDSGKWNIYSKVDVDNKKEIVKLSLKPNYKLVGYDSLTIPWKNLKAEFPLMKDVFISPVQDIAVIVLEDSIGIYEIKEDGIISSPLFNIPISKDEEVIMAEWCTGMYVQYWGKSFLNGKAIN